MNKVKFTTTINKDLLEKVKIIGVKEHRSVSDILNELIEKYVKEKGED